MTLQSYSYGEAQALTANNFTRNGYTFTGWNTKADDTIKREDEAAVKSADDAYNTLTVYEKSLVNEDAKKALDDAKVALAELNKPADANFPATGDNRNLWLWVSLLFVSGTALLEITINKRKRKATDKKTGI